MGVNSANIAPVPVSTPAEDTCFHCGLPVPTGSHYTVEIDGAARRMCCKGCEAVAQAIINAGLTDFYRYRTDSAPTAREIVPAFLR